MTTWAVIEIEAELVELQNGRGRRDLWIVDRAVTRTTVCDVLSASEAGGTSAFGLSVDSGSELMVHGLSVEP